MSIADNIERMRNRIEDAAGRSGKNGRNIKLVAATKTVGVEMINEAVSAGIGIIGESRVQELARKAPFLLEGPEIHMIGKLQSNKVKRALESCSMIQSLDRLLLAEKMAARGKMEGRIIRVLVQVNIGSEPNKGGIEPDLETLGGFLERLSGLGSLSVEGLMAIPPAMESPEAARPFFRRARELRDMAQEKYLLPRVSLCELSMGMSSDFEVAIEEGATMVRIGTALFGERRAL